MYPKRIERDEQPRRGEDIPASLMPAKKVIDLYSTFEHLGFDVWLDGGWGVDALLGEQTRPHADLDIVIQQQDVPRLRAYLEASGFHDVERDDTCAWNFVLGDADGHDIDVHAILFDAMGDGIYGPPEHGQMYPAASLTGKGEVSGHPVRCISAEYMVQFHTGYALRPHDFADVVAVCQRFGIAYPDEYAFLMDVE
jgi:lincosamide nucleotidyltransferase A/C/D/E